MKNSLDTSNTCANENSSCVEEAIIAANVQVTGVVQGVGFRPFIFNHAAKYELRGWVLNGSNGVEIHAEGTQETVASFIDTLESSAPPMARIQNIAVTPVPAESFADFSIVESVDDPNAMTLVSPDIATCADCVDELFDLSDRRFHYPFINCTNCGPRFTIIESIPYDRPATTMRDFPMCPECATEYRDPSDRRFHAQPDACFVCGPRLYLAEKPLEGDSRYAADMRAEGENPYAADIRAGGTPEQVIEAERERSDWIVARAAELLHAGKIVALKGLGGFHLACDATSQQAVELLRLRKHRPDKPLAIMVPTLQVACELCEVNNDEAALLTGTARPIVLLKPRENLAASEASTNHLADSVALGLGEIGVMLPYTPFQHLLLVAVKRPLVMTSGNVSGSPIVTDNEEALSALTHIADAFVTNDRGILSRYDDSVARVVRVATATDDAVFQTTFLRRARGQAPFPIPLPDSIKESATSVLGVGAEQKATFSLTRDGQAFVSGHIGDLENSETFDSWEQTLGLYERLFRITPAYIVHDLHPEYLSTKWALRQDKPLISVQHHHAHIAAVCAEHNCTEPVIGIAFDGTGYGDDNTIWGGEALIADLTQYRRLARLAPFSLPGGAAAVRRPAKIALSLLERCSLLQHPGADALRNRLAEGEERITLQMVRQNINSPLCSSMGRLFDAVSSLVGIADDASYEGSPAIMLESAMQLDVDASCAYHFALVESDGLAGLLDIEYAGLLEAILDDLAAGVSAGIIATRFHDAVARLIVMLAHAGKKHVPSGLVALGGGVFMNRYLLQTATTLLKQEGFVPLTPLSLPAGDGAVSYGQAVIGLSRI